MFKFRYSLKREETIGSLAKKVFDKYSIKNAFSDKIIETIQTTYDNTYFNRSDIINFIVDNIGSKQTYEVDSTTEDDVFKIQTIHSSKGLEYPVVILADMSTGGGGFGGAIEYRESLGLRQNKIYSSEPYPYSYDNWKKYVMSKCLTGDYDEERRLLYVAMTRAENYLFLTAEKNSESEFFNNLNIEPTEIELDIQPSLPKTEDRTELTVERPRVHAPVKYSAHSIIDTSEFERPEEGLGMEYGIKVHRFAEMYVKGEDIQPTNKDEKNVKQFIDSLEGELLTEMNCLLPLDIENKRILFQGIIDLIHINQNKVQIIDFKTDRDKSSITEYRKQLSIYHMALRGVYPDKEIGSYVFYTEDGNLTQIEPMDVEEINKNLLTA